MKNRQEIIYKSEHKKYFVNISKGNLVMIFIQAAKR